jgi:cell division protein FtsB
MSRGYTITDRGATMGSALWKLLSMFAPFIKEMILGDSNIEETIRRNKMIAFLMGCLILLFVIDLYTYSNLNALRNMETTAVQNNAVLTANLGAATVYNNTLSQDLSLERQRVTCSNTGGPSGSQATVQQLIDQNNALRAQIYDLQQKSTNVPAKRKGT